MCIHNFNTLKVFNNLNYNTLYTNDNLQKASHNDFDKYQEWSHSPDQLPILKDITGSIVVYLDVSQAGPTMKTGASLLSMFRINKGFKKIFTSEKTIEIQPVRPNEVRGKV